MIYLNLKSPVHIRLILGPFVGYLSGRFGHRAVVMAGGLLLGCSKLAIAYSPSLGLTVALYAIFGELLIYDIVALVQVHNHINDKIY